MRVAPWLFVLLALPFATGGASARNVSVKCGTVVDEDTILDRDLKCEGTAIILRNPRSVLQLNGHTIQSVHSCAEGAAPSGITVEQTAEGAQILGPGLVRGFVTGIAIGNAVRVQVRDVRISDSCGVGILVLGTDGARVRDVMLNRNGAASTEGGAVRVEQSQRFALEGSEIFANTPGAKGAALDLRDCDRCRIIANRIVANNGPGLRLDPESRGAVIERNVVLDHRGTDVIDQSNDGTYVFNVFERGDGLRPPALWPNPGPPAPAQPMPAGCGLMHTFIATRATGIVTCPRVGGLRPVRNSVVAYRTLNPFSLRPYGTCEPVEVRPDDGDGGSVSCTNPDRVFGIALEVTCCLN